MSFIVTAVLLFIGFDFQYLFKEYTLDLLVRKRWKDTRLSFSQRADVQERNISYIKVNEEVLNRMWVPDLFFANEKQAFFHTVTVPNIMLRVYPDGQILYSTR